MNIRKNKIWGIIENGKYQDYTKTLERWDINENKEIISVLRNKEADADLLGKHILLCPYCEKPVRILYQNSSKYPYIQHRFSDDSKNCVSEGDNKVLCQEIIRARKYEGRPAGNLHKKAISEISELIENLDNYKLLKKPEGNRLYHKNGNGKYRIPDIYFSYKGKEIVIEVQNSPEWIKVIAERRKFYRENGILLIWVYTTNDLIKNSVASIDISSGQKFNSFSFSSDCYHISLKDKELKLICSYNKPICKYEGQEYVISTVYDEELIGFSDISYHLDAVPYYFDYEKINITIKEECNLKNKLSDELNLPFSEGYYSHMLESACFSKFRCFSGHLTRTPIQELNNIAQCYIGVMFLIKFLKKYNSYEFALSCDKKSTLENKFKAAFKFWEAVNNGNSVMVKEMFEGNQRVSKMTVKIWKKTLESSENNSTLFFPEFKEFNQTILKKIRLLEEIISPKFRG